MAEQEKLFRYNGLGDSVFLDEFKVIRCTTAGKWIDFYGKEKFVLNNSRKRFAHETESAAKESFLARKRRHRKILVSQLENIDNQVDAIKNNRIGYQIQPMDLSFI